MEFFKRADSTKKGWADASFSLSSIRVCVYWSAAFTQRSRRFNVNSSQALKQSGARWQSCVEAA
jgi:hypothetical protein